MADIIYNRFKANLMNKIVDCEADTFKVMLCTSSYTPSADHNTTSDITNEVSGSGYSAGGAALSNLSVTQDDTDDEAAWDADDVTWSTSTITARYAVIYDDTLAGDDLVCCFDFTSDKSSSGGDFTIQWNAEGIINLT